MNTCASYHMTSDRGAFAMYESIPNTRSIKDANWGLGPIAGIGTIILQIGDGVLAPNEARHVPTLQSNLFFFLSYTASSFCVFVDRLNQLQTTTVKGPTSEPPSVSLWSISTYSKKRNEMK